MSDPIYNQTSPRAGGGVEKASATVGNAAGQAKAAVSEAASSVASQLRSTLDGQVESGAALIGHAASSIRCASEDLNKNAPALANVVGAVADKLDRYADDLQGKTADEVWADVNRYTRRQPALVFGMAALAGFLAYRTLKSSGSASARSMSNPREGYRGA